MRKKQLRREKLGLDELTNRGIEYVRWAVRSYREKENIFVIEATHALEHRSEKERKKSCKIKSRFFLPKSSI